MQMKIRLTKKFMPTQFYKKNLGIWGLVFEVGYSRAPDIGPGPPMAAWRKFGRAILSRNSPKNHLTKFFDWKILNSKQKLQAEAKAGIFLFSCVVRQIFCQNAKTSK